MRAIVCIALVLLSGCARVENLTKATCLPEGVPGDVVLKRTAYLYEFEGESHISLWDSPYRYSNGDTDAAGNMLLRTAPPLLVLPVGTHLSISRINRVHKTFPDKVIRVSGSVTVEQRSYDFVYAWGVDNKIGQAPWETSVYSPHDFGRTVECGG